MIIMGLKLFDKKYFLLFLLMLLPLLNWAQFTGAKVSLNGLTCSQCSRSVEMALRRVAFIQSIKMDLQKPAAQLTFKKNRKIDFAKIAKAVKDAGFSIGTIVADYDRSQASNIEYCFLDNDIIYHSVNRSLSDNGPKIKVLLLAKGLIGESELKRMEMPAAAKPCGLKSKYIIPFMLIP
jgi:copper chaperone CopZ